MEKKALILRNFEEVRRRSIMLWNGLPEACNYWKPDNAAMSAIELVRHVLQADYGWNIIINKGDMTNYKTPWDGRDFISVQDEIIFAQPYRETFLRSVNSFSEEQLSATTIIHPGNGAEKNLADYLLRIAYHESVHAGQFLSYLRAMKIDRPFIWD